MTSVKVKGNHIYASTQGSGVYSGIVSPDSSVTWDASRSNKPKANLYKIQIEIDPKNSKRIFASGYPGTFSGKLKNFRMPWIFPVPVFFFLFAFVKWQSSLESPSEISIIAVGLYFLMLSSCTLFPIH